MSSYQALQAQHQALLKRQETEADSAELIRAAQSYIDTVRAQSEQISAPRDRDQLRANLRFWASYIYDQTGVYPGTTLRPPQNTPPAFDIDDIPMPLPVAPPSPASGPDDKTKTQEPPTTPFERYSSARPDPDSTAPLQLSKTGAPLVIGAATGVLAILCLVIGVLFFGSTSGDAERETPTAATTPGPTLTASAAGTDGDQTPVSPLAVTHVVLTSGPSPFDRQTWVVKVQLAATGGNGEYIYWAAGQRLPTDTVVVEGQGCRRLSYQIGVTSGDQAVADAIEINPPASFGCR